MQFDILSWARVITILIGLIGLLIGILVARKCSGLLRYAVISAIVASVLIIIKKLIVLAGPSYLQNALAFGAWSDLIISITYLISAVFMLRIVVTISKKPQKEARIDTKIAKK